jgi:DME family drug/metabolite transporter
VTQLQNAHAMSPLVARLAVLGAAVLFSTGGAAIKLTHLGGWQVACCRSAIAAATILLFVPAARPPWSWRTLGVGTVLASTLVLFVLANKLTTAASSIFLQSTAPLYVIVLGPVLLRERISRRDLAFMVVLAAGLILFLAERAAPSATASNPALGNVLAAASGLTWALTIMGLRRIGSHGGSAVAAAQATAVGNLVAAALTAPLAFPLGAVTGADVGALLFLGMVQVGLAYVLLSAGVRHVRAFEASVLLLAEPALNPVWAWLVHGETPGPRAITGGAVILAATVINAWMDARSAPEEDAAPG